MKPRVTLPIRVAAAAAGALGAAIALPTASAGAAPAQPWQRYNYSPASRIVTPVAVYRSTGAVAAPNAVLTGRATTLQAKGASVTLDFGKEVGGLVTVHTTRDSSASQTLGVAFSESNQYVGTTSDASNGGSGPDGALAAAVGANSTWTTPAAKQRGGFRYLTLFAESDGPIRIDRADVHITFDPTRSNLRDYANHFYSSDPLLNRIWYAGAYTAQTNTIAPTSGRVWGPPPSGWDNSGTVGVGASVLVDGAKRDRTVWPGDLGVSVPTEYASLGDLTPTRNALTTLFDHQAQSGELPFAGPEVNFYGSDTYHLWTLIGTANYYQYTHDLSWLRGEWSNFTRALRYSLGKVGTDGLMNVTGTADWARSGQGGENIEANSLLYRALVTGAELAHAIGDQADERGWRGDATTVRAAVNDKLWDGAAGEYRDNPTSSMHPQDGNSLAAWYGVAPQARAQRISAALQLNWNRYGATTPEKNGEIGTFPGSMEVQAHFASGDANAGLELIRREWGYMLDSPLGTHSTFWEGYLADGQFGYGGAYMSAAHGWSTGPTSALSFYVLGIRPTTADGRYDIAPETGDLHWTQGSLRTPFGTISLSWQHDAAQHSYHASLTAPRTAVRNVDVPTYGAPVTVTVNGRTAWSAGRSRAYGAHRQGNDIVLSGLPMHATIDSRATGRVPTTLGINTTTDEQRSVSAGHSTSVPVTVRASGDRVVTGTVSASVPAGWTSSTTPFRIDTRNGPSTAVVRVVITAANASGGGPVDVPIVAAADGRRASTRATLLVFGAWPSGTSAAASSSHAPNTYNGMPRTYDPGNAIDGDFATFWNDDTSGAFPDTLTVTAPSAVQLHGVALASLDEGVPTDFTVQTWDGSAWVTSATVTGNDAVDRWIPFDDPVSTTQVRLVITASQAQNGNFSRVAELAS